MVKKRTLDGDDGNVTTYGRRKVSKSRGDDTPMLHREIPLEGVTDDPGEIREKRAGRGQGGAIDKLVKAVKKIRSDLYPPEEETTLDIPPTATKNAMAPSSPKPRQKRKAVTEPCKKPILHQDPPLNVNTPMPSQHKVPAGDGKFGFKPAMWSSHDVVQSTAPLESQEQYDTAKETNHQPRPQPRAVYGKSGKRVREVIPDSEEERSQQAQYKESYAHQSQTQRAINNGPEPGFCAEPSVRDSETEHAMESENNDHNSLNLKAVDYPVDFDDGPWFEEYEEMNIDSNANQHDTRDVQWDDNIIDEDPPIEASGHIEEMPLELAGSGNDRDSEHEVPFSVLDIHHHRNGKVQPPNPKRLEKSRRQHILHNIKSAKKRTKYRQNHAPKGKQFDEEDEDGAADDEGNATSSDSVTKEDTPSTFKFLKDVPKPTQMAFYKDDAAWTDVLNNAKDEFRLWIHSQVGFQERTEVALQTAWDFVLEAISKYQDDPYNIEPLNERLYNKQAMSILVFEEGATTRGALKTLCRTVTANHLQALLHPECESQPQYIATVKKNVNMLLKKSYFLQGRTDQQGRTRNFGHPLIADVCRQFYYSGKSNCLSILFPEEFKDRLPEPCLALVSACIQNCIHEYRTGFLIGCNFKGSTYGQVFLGMLKLIKQIRQNKYHSDRLTELLQDIATTGRMQSQPCEVNPEDLDLAVVLN